MENLGGYDTPRKGRGGAAKALFAAGAAILLAGCARAVFRPAPMALNARASAAAAAPPPSGGDLGFDFDLDLDFGSSSPWLRKNEDARVHYSPVIDKGVVAYKREFTVPCDDGVLVFNVGPAPVDASYEFEVYDDAYLWSNNGGLCFLYPHYQAYQIWSKPFWNESDPKYYAFKHVKRTQMHRISTKVNVQEDAKQVDSGIKAKGGDYVVFGGGKFWTPHYWDALRNTVHSWKKGTDVDEALEQWFNEQAFTE